LGHCIARKIDRQDWVLTHQLSSGNAKTVEPRWLLRLLGSHPDPADHAIFLLCRLRFDG
jgi:hypothetical protein